MASLVTVGAELPAPLLLKALVDDVAIGGDLSLLPPLLIAIARAIVGDLRVLVLDEATSSLDAESEWLVQQGLERASAGRTTLVIAHRLATVRQADRIVFLDGGRVRDAGRHDELYERNDHYRRLCDLHLLRGEASSPA